MSTSLKVDLQILDEGIAPRYSLLVKPMNAGKGGQDLAFMVHLAAGTPKARAEALADLLGELASSAVVVAPQRSRRFGSTGASAV